MIDNYNDFLYSYKHNFKFEKKNIISNIISVVNSSAAATISPSGSVNVCAGASVTLNTNTGSGLTYQWYRNNSIINGAIQSTYLATDSGTYTVIVTNVIQ